jgi:hypothetical protein
MRAISPAMNKNSWQLIVFFAASLVFAATACRKYTEAPIEICLAQMQQVFDLTWPTNYTDGHAGIYTYSSMDHGHNEIIFARLQIDSVSYQDWLKRVSDRLASYEDYPAIYEKRLVKKFPWWDSRAFSGTKAIHFYCATNLPNFEAKLDIDAVKTNGYYYLFIMSR